jgi:hypothetical protein
LHGINCRDFLTSFLFYIFEISLETDSYAASNEPILGSSLFNNDSSYYRSIVSVGLVELSFVEDASDLLGAFVTESGILYYIATAISKP